MEKPWRPTEKARPTDDCSVGQSLSQVSLGSSHIAPRSGWILPERSSALRAAPAKEARAPVPHHRSPAIGRPSSFALRIGSRRLRTQARVPRRHHPSGVCPPGLGGATGALVPRPRVNLIRYHGVFTPGFLPLALWASLRLFNIAPGDVVRPMRDIEAKWSRPARPLRACRAPAR